MITKFKRYLLTIMTIHSWLYFIRKELLWFSCWMIFITFTQSECQTTWNCLKQHTWFAFYLTFTWKYQPLKNPTHSVSSVLKITFRGQETVCRGGIVKRYIQELFTEGLKSHHHSFLTSLPQQCQQLKANDIQNPIKQFRCLLRVSCFLFPATVQFNGVS